MKTIYLITAILLLSGNSVLAVDDDYYLACKKSRSASAEERKSSVLFLVKSLDEAASGLRGQLLGYLQDFAPADFDAESRAALVALLTKPNSPHYGKLVLLAGYLNIGRDELYRQYMTPELPVKRKWNLALALARTGDEKALNYCLEKVKKAPLDNQIVGYVLPDLLYTRQKAAVDYCVKLLYNDEKHCRSANPDSPEAIPCAYRIIELLSPLIIDFPVKVNPDIGLESDNYPETLQSVRDWLKAHPDYKIQNSHF
ncbi:MAG: hypothetical protein LBG15_15795 [Dysgonamonadaceae bacterium]|jgi:hypothetical protein|nr:hypothetical protein [Dysgonamonadaceae bacterium]